MGADVRGHRQPHKTVKAKTRYTVCVCAKRTGKEGRAVGAQKREGLGDKAAEEGCPNEVRLQWLLKET